MEVIKNLPEYTKNMEFIVVLEQDGKLYFHSGYHRNAEKAYKVAKEVDGIVVHNLRV